MSELRRNPYEIVVDARKCRRCSYCVQHCPGRAIKLEKEKIRLLGERCIYCGSCITACPQGALHCETGLGGVKELIGKGGKIVACLDPAFPAALDAGTPRQLATALKRMGFTEVWEGSFGAELVSEAYRKLLAGNAGGPLISSLCPVIVSYVQKYLPQLIPNMVPFVSPMIAAGRVVRRVKDAGWKVVYITSCLAHMGEMSSPEVAGVIDEVITFRDMKELIEDGHIDFDGLEESEFDGPRPFLGRIIPVIGGLGRSMGTSFDVLVDDVSVAYGRRRVMGALNQLAQGYLHARFFDLVYCDGCVDGPFMDSELSVLGRRQIVARYAKEEIGRQDQAVAMAERDHYSDVSLAREFRNLEQKLPTPSEEEIRAILRKVDKLPPANNLDCRACGYPTCRDKAIAVAQGIAEAEHCLPYLHEQSRKIYQQLEKSHKELQISHQQIEQAQVQLIRTEKLAALGQLAAGVAHEINNPLGTITIYAHLLFKSLEADDPRREDVSLIIKEASRTKDIVQGLLSFARETKLRPGPTNINDVLDDVLGLLVNQPLFHNIRIKKVFSPAIPTIVADGTQVKQVFLNIILNAAQAMEGKGTLTIITSQEKKNIIIKVQDTGPGIPPEVVGKVFSPFFTTKEKGTGLGLAISYGIIERHGGKIDMDTRLGKGSTFTIMLPIRNEEKEQKEEQFDKQTSKIHR